MCIRDRSKGPALPVLARVVGDVPARPLELDGGSGEELLHLGSAGRALGDGRVRELADQLETAAFGAKVLVERQIKASGTTVARPRRGPFCRLMDLGPARAQPGVRDQRY